MKTRNITIGTIRHLKKFNNIRKIRADVFALAQLSPLSYLLNTHYTENEIKDQMNKLGFRTATGLPWSSKSVNRLRRRLDSLLCGIHPKRPHRLATTYTSDELEQLQFMYRTHLDALCRDKSDLSDMRDHMCLWALDY
jgi:hypothetical protein